MSILGLSACAAVTWCVLMIGTSSCHGQPQQLGFPPDLKHCQEILNQKAGANATHSTDEARHAECLQYILLKNGGFGWSGYNGTQEDMEYFTTLSKSLVHRSKRQAIGGRRGRYLPRTGFRIRREYRRLGTGERNAFHAALNVLKQNGEYDRFANLHQGVVVTSAHGGPNFFGWHRVYLSLFEEALRRVNFRISLPYWDSTMDFDMENPADSILWSAQFFGNGDGFVTTGPFANWQTPAGPLTRNVAEGSRLLSKMAIRQVLTRCRLREISEPTAAPDFNLELLHGGPHVWVGGQMSGLNTAAHDPVFFLHHAFIDYIWEMFRNRQARICGVNPNRDYPESPGQHSAGRPMDGLPPYRNIDGIRGYWTRFWYNYERPPRCSRRFPFCSSPHLQCNVQRGVCVSRARVMVTPDGQARPASAFAANGARMARGRFQAARINVGRRFRAPPSDGRTQDATRFGAARSMRMPRMRRRPRRRRSAFRGKIGLMGLQFGPKFSAPAADPRNNKAKSDQDSLVGKHPTILSSTSHTIKADFSETGNIQIDPKSGFPSFGSTQGVIQPTQQNPRDTVPATPMMDTSPEWTFLPINIVHERRTNPNKKHVPKSTKRQENGIPEQPSQCNPVADGVKKLSIISEGLNYPGNYSELVVTDARLSLTSSITYIGVKSFKHGQSQVRITVKDRCSRKCQPRCRIPGSWPPKFYICGDIWWMPASYTGWDQGKTRDAAFDRAWQQFGAQPETTQANVQIMFYCVDGQNWHIPCNVTPTETKSM